MKNRKFIFTMLIVLFYAAPLFAAWPSLSSRSKNWSSSEILTETDLENSFDEIHTYTNAALNSSTGHKHDATTAEGPKIAVLASTVTGDTAFSGGISFTQTSGGPDVDIDGDLSVGQQIEVTGDGTFSGDVQVAGDINLTGNLTLAGQVNLGYPVRFSGVDTSASGATSSSSYQTSNLAVTFTPKSSSSEILAMYSLNGIANSNNLTADRLALDVDGSTLDAASGSEYRFSYNAEGTSSGNRVGVGTFRGTGYSGSTTFTVIFKADGSNTLTLNGGYLIILEVIK